MTGRSRDDVNFSHNLDNSRYELRVGGELVGTAEYAEYSEEPDSVALTHTVVREEFRHQGYSSMLVKFAAEDIIASGRRIKPYCSYAASYLGKHREFSHHVSWPQETR
ncbi:GNAT family N-acetyltransferase [Arthrobacter sp. G119Y2]|uniref:GNAT family N-acetyltransferase n=1 Tax=Arthrobacter sp. G119Y2 TaxID=3134965 RepID=UPI0031195FCB